MITGTKIKCRVVDDNGVSITSENLCLLSVPDVRPHKGEFIWIKDGTIRYLVVSGDWCRLYEEKEIYGFKLTLRKIDTDLKKENESMKQELIQVRKQARKGRTLQNNLRKLLEQSAMLEGCLEGEKEQEFVA